MKKSVRNNGAVKVLEGISLIALTVFANRKIFATAKMGYFSITPKIDFSNEHSLRRGISIRRSTHF